jgi:murein DD-endopeptidase MepM/ murein hydrolase activator NlpD
VVSGFGQRWGRLHAGVDIAAGAGTGIRAAASGTVTVLQGEGASGGYGNFVCIQHGGAVSTCYAHLSSFAVSGGASVSQGQVIGAVGCTGHCYGDHLHFEVRVNGSPVDPLGYL